MVTRFISFTLLLALGCDHDHRKLLKLLGINHNDRVLCQLSICIKNINSNNLLRVFLNANLPSRVDIANHMSHIKSVRYVFKRKLDLLLGHRVSQGLTLKPTSLLFLANLLREAS